MVDIDAIKLEISRHPEWATLDDADVLIALQAIVRSVRRPIPAAEIKKLWARWLVLAKCWVTANTATAPIDARVVCYATYSNLDRDIFADLDLDDPTQAPDIRMYLDGLVAAGVLNDAQRAATVALANAIEQPFADAEQHDVWIARGQPVAR